MKKRNEEEEEVEEANEEEEEILAVRTRPSLEETRREGTRTFLIYQW